MKKEDAKVFSNLKFEKDARFFKDALAFFDAYSKVCQQNKADLPKFLWEDDKKFSLDGVCLFIQTYAAQFDFESLEISIDYLKTLYFSIAALSSDGKTVSRDLLVSEFLVHKDINKKQFETIKKAEAKSKAKFLKQKEKVETTSEQAKLKSTASKCCFVFSIGVIALFFVLGSIAMALFYSKRLNFDTAMVYAVSSLFIGVVFHIELRVFAKSYKTLADEQFYSLLSLKKNFELSKNEYFEIKTNFDKVLAQKNIYEKAFEAEEVFKKVDFDEILQRANALEIKTDFDTYIRGNQEQISVMLEEIALASLEDTGKFENLYREIVSNDHLRFNKLVLYCFLDKFCKSAEENHQFELEFLTQKVMPFGVNIKKLLSEKAQKGEKSFLGEIKAKILDYRKNVL